MSRFLPQGADVQEAVRNGCTDANNPEKPRKWHLALGRDTQHYGFKAFLRFPVHEVLTIPFQFTTEPILDSVGTPAWGNMLRRTRSMFHLAQNYVSQPWPYTASDYRPAAGTIFFGRLRAFLQEKGKTKTALEVYAHSMGAIVINEAYARFPDFVPIRLYLWRRRVASANSRTQPGSTSLKTRYRFTILVSIPAPSSTIRRLLEFLSVVASWLGSTNSLKILNRLVTAPLAHFENIIIARDFLPKRAPIYLKAFPIEDGGKTHNREKRYRGPQRHGEFDQYYFWEEQFRSTALATDYYERLPKGDCPNTLWEKLTSCCSESMQQ